MLIGALCHMSPPPPLPPAIASARPLRLPLLKLVLLLPNRPAAGAAMVDCEPVGGKAEADGVPGPSLSRSRSKIALLLALLLPPPPTRTRVPCDMMPPLTLTPLAAAASVTGLSLLILRRGCCPLSGVSPAALPLELLLPLPLPARFRCEC